MISLMTGRLSGSGDAAREAGAARAVDGAEGGRLTGWARRAARAWVWLGTPRPGDGSR